MVSGVSVNNKYALIGEEKSSESFQHSYDKTNSIKYEKQSEIYCYKFLHWKTISLLLYFNYSNIYFWLLGDLMLSERHSIKNAYCYY